ncbi:MAG: DipZ protein [Actinomycetota bacterium]|nr:DipZ protein [Actinomycetota bacterium]
MRAPVDTIHAPPFPQGLEWVNVRTLRMDKQLGRPVLIEFFDFCRPNSLRTLPYVRAWHGRYADGGLRVVSAHCPGFPPGRDAGAVRDAVGRLGIEHAVCLDPGFALWRAYDNEGWPARYLFDADQKLFEFHLGEGGYADTERAIQELLGVTGELVAPVHPEDVPDAAIVAQTADQPGAYSGPYAAGAVWVVVDGAGTLEVNGSPVAVDAPGALRVLDHPHHTEGVVDLRPRAGVTVHATCFTPGVAPPAP